MELIKNVIANKEKHCVKTADQYTAKSYSRMSVSERIGAWKKANGVAPLQPERYREIGERLKEKGERLGLDEAFMLRIWELIHNESLRKQA